MTAGHAPLDFGNLPVLHRSAAKIVRSPGFPDSVWEMAGPILEENAVLLPQWLHVLNVYWSDDQGECAASITIYEEYRRADLNIHPNWISRPDKQRDQIVHELLHLHTDHLHHQVERLINAMPKGPARDVEREQSRLNVERGTCDLAYVITDMRGELRR